MIVVPPLAIFIVEIIESTHVLSGISKAAEGGSEKLMGSILEADDPQGFEATTFT